MAPNNHPTKHDHSDGGTGGSTINPEVVNTKTLQGAEQASEHATVQDAIDTAGAGGTVVFDAEGDPYQPTARYSFYDDQTIILNANIESNNVGVLIDLSGLSGVTVVPNGHTLDGLDRANGASIGIKCDGSSTDCVIDGVVRTRRVTRKGVSLQGTRCTAGTVIGDTLGDKSSNDTVGDLVNFGSVSQSQDCSVSRVIGRDVARHTVTFGSKNPQDCAVEYVRSVNPGGAHVSMEEADRAVVGTVIGDGARQAANYSNPASTYNGYPEIFFANAGISGTNDSTVERVISRNPAGSGPCVGFGNSTNNNSVEDLTSINAAGNGVKFGTGAGGGPKNSVGVRKIRGADGNGVIVRTQSDCTALGVGKGQIHECQRRGVWNNGLQNVTIRDLHIYANGQDGSTTEGIFFDGTVDGSEVVRCRIEDGASGAQSVGVAYDGTITANYMRFIGNDTHNSSTPWSITVGSNDAAAGNTPTP